MALQLCEEGEEEGNTRRRVAFLLQANPNGRFGRQYQRDASCGCCSVRKDVGSFEYGTTVLSVLCGGDGKRTCLGECSTSLATTKTKPNVGAAE